MRRFYRASFALFAAAAFTAGAARSEAAEIALAPIVGATRFDSSLERYGWVAQTRPFYGAEAAVRQFGWGAGLRAGRSTMRQSTALLGTSFDTTARLWSVEAFAEAPLVSLGVVSFAALGAVGQLFANYSPDRALITTDGGGGAVEVRYENWNEWSASGGIALRAGLTRALVSSIAIERRVFRIDTAHRQGDAIVESRETFGGWVARAGLSWRMNLV